MLLSYKRLPHLVKSFWQWVVVRRNIYSLLWKVEFTTNVQDSTGSTSQLIVSAVFIFKKIKLAETWQYWAPLLLNKFSPRLAEQEDIQMKRLQQIISCPLFIEKLALLSFSLPVLPRPIFSIWSFCEQQKPNRRETTTPASVFMHNRPKPALVDFRHALLFVTLPWFTCRVEILDWPTVFLSFLFKKNIWTLCFYPQGWVLFHGEDWAAGIIC